MSEQRRISQADVCQTCGDRGYKELLLCCSKCQISMEHRYCLRKIPKADDVEFKYICTHCVSTSTEQISHKRTINYVTRNSLYQGRKHQRLIQYQKRGKVNRTSPVTMNTEVQRHESPQLQTTVSEPFVDVSPQPSPNDNTSHPNPNIGDQPATIDRDLDTRPMTICSSLLEVEAEVQTLSTLPSLQTSNPHSEVQTLSTLPSLQTSNPHSEVQTRCVSPLDISTSKPLVKDVLPEAYLGKNNRSLLNVCPPAALVQDLKSGHVKTNSSLVEIAAEVHTPGIPPATQTLAKTSSRCLRKVDPHVALVQDPKMGLVRANSSVAEIAAEVHTPCIPTQTLNALPVEIAAEVDTPGIPPATQTLAKTSSRCLRKVDQHVALVPAPKMGLVRANSSIAETAAEVHAPGIPPHTLNPLPVKVVLPEANLNDNKMASHCFDVNGNDVQELQRNNIGVVQANWDKSDAEFEVQDPQTDPVPYAQPIFDPVWMGCFEFSKEIFGSVVAHLSNKACLKVVEAAKLMPMVLCIKTMSRLEIWPASFNISGPTDENIALYFFAGNERSGKGYDLLVNHVVNHDLAMKVLFENVELLIFSSNQLPLQFRRFSGKYYLWGVFRGRKDLSVPKSVDTGDTQVSSTECPVSLLALGINSGDSPEYLRMSPLSTLNPSGSCPSDSSCTTVPKTSKKRFSSEGMEREAAK